jgi:hypothetical protein
MMVRAALDDSAFTANTEGCWPDLDNGILLTPQPEWRTVLGIGVRAGGLLIIQNQQAC